MGADQADDRVRSATVENGIQRAVATNAQPERLRKAVQSSAAHSGHRRDAVTFTVDTSGCERLISLMSDLKTKFQGEDGTRVPTRSSLVAQK